MNSGTNVAFQLLLILSVIHFSSPKDGAELSPEKRLIKQLLKDYEERGRMGRPVEHQNDTLLVKYGLSLIQILDLDERNQVLSTNIWANYLWKDIYMQWDPAEFNNITTVRVPSHSIWQPDIKLYNYADERREEKRDALLVVSHDGTILWIPQAIFKSSCAIDIMHFPFDIQICKMKFGSWTYDGSKIDLAFYYETEQGFEFSDYVKSNEWDILTSSSIKNVHRYQCCPDPFVDLVFELVMKRKPAFYNYILILPCILLSSLTLVLFWLPPESPAKMQLGMNIFVAFFVLLLLLAESTPPAASSIPLIGAYYCLNMILITLSTFLSVIVVNLYFRGSRTEVPTFLKKIFIEFLARLMCMRDQVRDVKNKAKLKTQQQTLLNKDKNFKYDKVGYFEMQTEESWKCLSNGTSSLSNDLEVSPQQRNIYALEADVRDIKIHLQKLYDRTVDKEAKEKIAREWRIVALVLDRLFFFIYLTAIVVSIFTVFQNVLFNFSS